MLEYCLVIGYILIFLDILYIYITRSSKQIIIKQKILDVQWGFTRFIIVDSYGKLYFLTDSLWFGKSDSLDIWIKIKLNKKYTINYYGLDMDALGIKCQIIDLI